ncbi:MAG: hypothetical protein KDE31_32660, partial [Caldilineaceae bacterium]|nr:hypothetical protein [Caldilineaceae bacterium]
WRVRAESAPNVALGGWSDVRHFFLAKDLVASNPYDFRPPKAPQSLMAAADMYRPEFTYIGSSTTAGTGDYELGDLHILRNRIDLTTSKYPQAANYFSFAFAFGVSPSISAPVRYALYIDTDHIYGSGASADLMGKPITVADLYLPEHMIVIERDDNVIVPADVTIFSWNGSSWDPGLTLADLGGDAWFTDDNAVQILVPYTALSTADGTPSGSLAVTVISTSTSAGDGIFDSIPLQENNTIDAPAIVSDMLMPIYPFDTPLSNPIIHEDMPPLRWRMPYFDSVDGYEIQITTDPKFTTEIETWKLSESQTSTFFSFLTTVFQSRKAYEDNESYYWRVRMLYERHTSSLSQFETS